MQDVIVLEEKNMNESVKMKYLDDFTEDLTEINFVPRTFLASSRKS